MKSLPKEFVVTHPTVEDADKVLELQIACDIAEYGEPDSDLEDLLDEWEELDLRQSAWLILDKEKNLAGYAATTEDDGDYTINFYVHPNGEGEKLAAHLLILCGQYIQKQLEENVAKETEATTIVSHVNKRDIVAVEAAGFQPDTYYFRMQVDLDAEPEQPIWPEGATIRTFTETQDAQAVYDFVQNAFARPGFVPPLFENWRDYMMRADHFDSDLWFLLEHQNELVGTALCYSYPEHGWVRQLAVSPLWRRQGIGAALLQYVFQVFYAHGQSKIALGMNSENANAYQLYERVGMEKVRQYDEYAKVYKLDGGSLPLNKVI